MRAGRSNLRDAWFVVRHLIVFGFGLANELHPVLPLFGRERFLKKFGRAVYKDETNHLIRVGACIEFGDQAAP